MVKGKGIRSFGEAVTPPPFHPDDPKVEVGDIIGKEITVTDAVIVRDFTTSLGSSDFALLRFETDEPEAFATTLCGGSVVVRKVQKALSEGLLPLRGTITRVPSQVAGHSPYYDIN